METPFSPEVPVRETGNEKVLSGFESVMGCCSYLLLFVEVPSTGAEAKREVQARRSGGLQNHLSDYPVPVPKWA